MLILSRRPMESIRIGADIRVRILSLKGNQIRLGIIAPGEVIDREEIYERKQREAGAEKFGSLPSDSNDRSTERSRLPASETAPYKIMRGVWHRCAVAALIDAAVKPI